MTQIATGEIADTPPDDGKNKAAQDLMSITQVEAILLRDGHVLLGRRASHRRSFPNFRDVPGGHVEEGENVEHALLREVQEELGVVPRPYELAASLLLVIEPEATCSPNLFRVDAWSGGEP
jgi:8-oxo-dGTP pyrophosphatase MutT (NUDIX family)